MNPALRAQLEAMSADVNFDRYADTPHHKVAKKAGNEPLEPRSRLQLLLFHIRAVARALLAGARDRVPQCQRRRTCV